MAMAPSSSSPYTMRITRLFATTWLARLIILCSFSIIRIEGARHPRSRGGGMDGGGGGGTAYHHPRFHPSNNGRRNKRKNNKKNDYSPNINVLNSEEEEEDDFYSKSFYERNGVEPPPLISRAERLRMHRQEERLQQQLSGRRRRRRAQDAANEEEEEEGGDVEMELFDNGEALAAIEEEEDTSEIDAIIALSKSGQNHPTTLRRDLIRSTYYDKHAYPWDYAWYNQPPGSRSGVPVEFSINFHRVFSVDVIQPVMDLVVWMRIQWVDPRLTWKPEEYGNLTKTWFWIGDGGAGGETSEIWTPDIELWNLEEGLRDSFDDAYAIVSHDGSIFWSRPGHLRPVCKYYGLNKFPFDSLTCTMEFGSWAYSGKYMRLVKGGGDGFSIGGSDTAGSTYNEFSFIEEEPVTCVERVYPPYPASPEEDWPVLLYNITIARSWEPYVRGYITMQILLNIVGFSAFWLPPSCGERMGLSITAMLAAVAAEIVVAANLPAASEYTWFQKFSLLSMGFAFISLIECVAVLYFYYKRSEDMIPWWFTEFRKWYIFRQARKRGGQLINNTATSVTHLVAETSNHITEVIHKRNSDSYDPKYDDDDSFSDNQKEAIASSKEDCSVESEKDDEVGDIRRSQKRASLGNSEDFKASLNSSDGFKVSSNNVDHACDNSLELELSDHDYGIVETGRAFADSMISNVSFEGDSSDPKFNYKPKDLKPTPRVQRQGVRRGGSKNVRFSGVNQEQFPKDHASDQPHVSLPPQTSRRTLMQQFQQQNSGGDAVAAGSTRSLMVPRDADDFNNEEEIEHNRQWKNVAARIDDVARFWIPMAFAISLAIVLAEVF